MSWLFEAHTPHFWVVLYYIAHACNRMDMSKAWDKYLLEMQGFNWMKQTNGLFLASSKNSVGYATIQHTLLDKLHVTKYNFKGHVLLHCSDLSILLVWGPNHTWKEIMKKQTSYSLPDTENFPMNLIGPCILLHICMVCSSCVHEGSCPLWLCFVTWQVKKGNLHDPLVCNNDNFHLLLSNSL